MSWGRAKTILIIVFLLVDLFLCLVLIQTRQATKQISADIVKQTVSVLEKKEIYISEDIIPTKRAENKNIMMKNYFEAPFENAKRMLGEEFETLENDAEKHRFVFQNERGILSVANHIFTFDALRSPEPLRENHDKISSIITSALKELGFREKDFTLNSLRFENGLAYCRALPLYKKQPISGIGMEIVADSIGILKLTGSFFTAQSEETYDENLLDITGVLTRLMYREELKGSTILSIENAFYAPEVFSNSREISVLPVYMIKTDANKTWVCDARTGFVYLHE